MWQAILKFGLYGLGLSAILIGSGLSLLGPEWVANFFNQTFGLIKLDGPISDLSTANIESELRFFGIMFAFYGAVLLWAVRDYLGRFGMIPVLLLVFFLSGLARLLGYFTVGPPHLLFKVLMVIEICLPIILWSCWLMERKRQHHR